MKVQRNRNWFLDFGPLRTNGEPRFRHGRHLSLVEAHKWPPPRPFTAPHEGRRELQRIRPADAVLDGQPLGQRADLFGGQDFIPRVNAPHDPP